MRDGRRRRKRGDSQTIVAEQAAAYGVTVPKELSPSDRYLSPNDIGKILNITGEAVKQWIYHGRLPAVKLANGYWKVKVSDFEAFLKARHEIGRRRILIADAQDSVGADLSQGIEKLGHRPVSAHNYADAMLKASDQHPSLVILNVSSKEIDPWKLAERMRATKALRNVPILLIANAELSDSDAERALDLQAQGFLKRPVDTQTLGQELQRILNRAL